MKLALVLLVASIVGGCSEGEILNGEYFPLDTPIRLKVGDDYISWYNGLGTLGKIEFIDSSAISEVVNANAVREYKPVTQKAAVLRKGAKSELIYIGTNNNVLEFLYREHFISEVEGEYIHPPFSLRLHIDTSKDKSFSFRGYRFNVLSHDGDSVTLSARKL